MDALTPARELLIDSWPQVMKPWGIPKAAARIHALLLSAPDSLPPSDIKSTLSISDGSISTQLRLLEELGMVERLRIMGTRGYRYRAIEDPGLIFSALARARRQDAFLSMERVGPALTSIAGKEDLDWLQTVGTLRLLAQLMDRWLALCTHRDPEWTVKAIQALVQENTHFAP